MSYVGRNDGPAYSLDEAKRLARAGMIRSTQRVDNYLYKNEGEPTDVLADLICSIDPDDYYKTDELRFKRGVLADIYKPIPYVGLFTGKSNDWYVKFYISTEDDGIKVLTACIDGDMH